MEHREAESRIGLHFVGVEVVQEDMLNLVWPVMLYVLAYGYWKGPFV